MRTVEYVNSKLKQMGAIDTWGTKKEINELPSILHEHEELLYITSGTLEGNTWLICCTSERIIFLDKGMVFGLKQKEIPLDKINSIEHKKGLLLGKIIIWDGASKIAIENITKETINPMIDILNSSIRTFKEASNKVQYVNNGANLNQEDTISKLERLAKLKEQGILDENEFRIEKAKILNY